MICGRDECRANLTHPQLLRFDLCSIHRQLGDLHGARRQHHFYSCYFSCRAVWFGVPLGVRVALAGRTNGDRVRDAGRLAHVRVGRRWPNWRSRLCDARVPRAGAEARETGG